MNEFFTLTSSLSAYSKWVLIRLIVDKTIGDELSKTDFIERGCPYNKFNVVVGELLNIDAISKLKVEHFNRGRPKDCYNFIFNESIEMSKLIPNEMLSKIEGKDFRVPVKIVWSFFVLNQDKFGHVENFSVPTIANACGLKNIEAKTAVTKLIEHDLILELTKGCTYKKSELMTHYINQDVTKRPSAYLVSPLHINGKVNIISTGITINFNSVLNVAEGDKGLYINNIIKAFPSSKCLNSSKHIQENLMSEDMYNAFKIYLDMQPKNVLDNLRSTLSLLFYKFLKLPSSNPKKRLSIIHVSNSLFGTRDIFNMNSTLFHLCSFITNYINLYSHSFLFHAFFGSEQLSFRNIKAYLKKLSNIKIDISIKLYNLFIINHFSSCSDDVKDIYYSKIEKPK
ncbi:hypothetical protein [Pseudoalteromonas sp. SMN1298-MNA-CIBAN-0114]|uniref:hypothetical protein n=1 Tax=Pseudoalteromonas sp. SMN1298-MNA-CIBAN-0114 TaxID=3140428 RepID=UPI0033176F4C